MKNLKRFNEMSSYEGRPISVGQYVYHVHNPVNRETIKSEGLSPRSGGPQRFDHFGDEGKYKDLKAVFATNSDNRDDWFDSTWDDDVWRIDTSKVNGEWFEDINYSPTKLYKKENKHVLTFSSIPPEAMYLVYEGSGADHL